METKEVKERILKLLKEKGELSTSKISAELNLNYYYAEKYLEEILNEKDSEIELNEKGKSKFWSFKK